MPPPYLSIPKSTGIRRLRRGWGIIGWGSGPLILKQMKNLCVTLKRIKRTYPALLIAMQKHYSAPKGFVGRNICYSVSCAGKEYGFIVGGSATLHLPGRDEFFGWKDNKRELNNVVNNIFFHIEKIDNSYPIRNFTTCVVSAWRDRIQEDWYVAYQDIVIGFETLVELPRVGDLYIKDGWVNVGKTKGFTCKREAGIGTDAWTGRRVWNTEILKPKLVFVRKVRNEYGNKSEEVFKLG